MSKKAKKSNKKPQTSNKKPQSSNRKTVVIISAIVAVVLIAAVIILAVNLTSNNSSTTSTNTDSSTTSVTSENTQNKTYDPETISGMHHIEIDMKDYGVIKVELNADVAPISVANFMNLSDQGFYDGLTLHRIISGFMMQGGDPLGNGTGGSEETIKGEFSSNGVENNLSHTRGAISMARSTDMDSASSQFFIVHQDSTYLDGSYACFGYVTEGIEIVDEICENTPVTDSNGTVESANQPIINSIKVID